MPDDVNPPLNGLADRVVVVSLPSSSERRDHVRRHFDAISLRNWDFHDARDPDHAAVRTAFDDGRVAGFPPCFRCGGTDCGRADCNNVLIPAQVAVFSTYLDLWDRISRGGENVLVCEDDIVFHPWWRRGLTLLRAEVEAGRLDLSPYVPSMVRLAWAENEEHDAGTAFRLSRELRMANPCHLLTPAYAKRLIEEFDRFDQTADMFMHRHAPVSRDHAWTVHPPIATELSWSRGEVASLIHPKAEHADHLRRTGQVEAAEDYDRLRVRHLSHMFHRRFLIVGHPRCGTGFTASYLRRMGFDIGHEADGRDGIASWMFAVEGDVPYAMNEIARRREALRWDLLIAPVRDLRTAVPSVMRDNVFASPSYAFRRDAISEAFGLDLNALPTNFARAVASCVYWMRLVERMSPDLIYRIEHDYQLLHGLAGRHTGGKIPDPSEMDLSPVNVDKPDKNVCRPKHVIVPADWASLDVDLWGEVEHYCARYGYDLPERHAPNRPPVPRADAPLTGLGDTFCRPSGWSRSAIEQRPVRADGTPTPWFTFGAIEFLERIVRRGDRVFEYGAGYSTLWWQSRAASVTSVEHDAKWCDELRGQVESNVTLTHRGVGDPSPPEAVPVIECYRRRMRRSAWPHYDAERIVRRGLDDDAFGAYAAEISAHGAFDIIVIDGMARRLCAEFAVRHVSEEGLIILDNSNRSDYDAAFNILEEADFRQIPFWGLVAGADFMTCTSVFLKSLSRLAPGTHVANSLGLPEY